jgi:hypothetical protein
MCRVKRQGGLFRCTIVSNDNHPSEQELFSVNLVNSLLKTVENKRIIFFGNVMKYFLF